MCTGLPRRSQATYEVAAKLCLLSQDIIYKPIPVDVASTLEVNHIKLECYVIVFTCCICHSLHELCLQLNVCMCYSVHSIIEG